MPKVPPPEELEDAADRAGAGARDEFPEHLREWISRPRPFETRPVILDGPGDRPPRPPFDNIWFRAAGPVPGDIRQRQILLAYVSDMTLLDTSLLPHGKSFFSAVQMASIDHAMWFHRDAPLGRVAALCPGQSLRIGRAGLQPRPDLHARRPLDRFGGAGRIDPAARRLGDASLFHKIVPMPADKTRRPKQLRLHSFAR